MNSLTERSYGIINAISVYDHGYVLYTAGNQSTVFPLHSCDDYEYVSVTGDNKEFNKEFFDNENWYIRLLMEAEDRMAYSQSKISTNHGVFSNSDVTDDAEIMRGSSKDFVDDVIDREILNALIKELTERQKTVAADCLPACLEATARSYPWHLPSLEMKEARSSGHGMDLTAMWRGVPALPAGVGIRQD